MKIIVTGSSGFVGSNLINTLPQYGFDDVVVVGRRNLNCESKQFIYADFSTKFNVISNLKGASAIVHCAAQNHVMKGGPADLLREYRQINVVSTLELANQAAKAGVKRFIFISSIKVNGECTNNRNPYSILDEPNPNDYYGISKLNAEQELLKLSKRVDMDVVIIRPTLIYGPSVKGNFSSLLNFVYRGLPLPFRCIDNNKRSLISIKNLVDLIITCIDHPHASNQVFFASDDNDISTSEIVNEIANTLGKSNRQLPIPVWCYILFGKLFNKSDVVNRLTGSLQVDITHTKKTLSWEPPQTLQEGFKQTANAFLKSKGSSNL